MSDSDSGARGRSGPKAASPDRWRSRTQALSQGPSEGDEAELDAEALERLRSLAYLD